MLLFIVPVVLVIALALFIIYKKNHPTALYSEGVRNENDGRYSLALNNYEDALSEIRKLNLNNKFGEKIAQRIKILKTTIEYENNFQTTRSNNKKSFEALH